MEEFEKEEILKKFENEEIDEEEFLREFDSEEEAFEFLLTGLFTKIIERFGSKTAFPLIIKALLVAIKVNQNLKYEKEEEFESEEEAFKYLLTKLFIEILGCLGGEIAISMIKEAITIAVIVDLNRRGTEVVFVELD